MNWLLRSLRLQKLRAKLLSDPYYRLQSAEDVQMAIELGIQIDVNQATVDDWLRLPGLSIHQGRSLVELSRSGVVFYCVEDLAAALGMPLQRLFPLKPLLNFSYYDEQSLDSVKRININTASVVSLMKVPLIDSSLAELVVENRELFGNYRNLLDLQKRLQLSGDEIAQLMYYLQF
ncbi:ComEA family DNA-binding protein [Anabaena sp. FACHB-1237]|uniref:helix-hairpin-helix domain-containing protein n=1 Tax=Anabaena sp. FACHB-1237 TaxID=2692769 RepID=UPI0016812C29|nr:ComEA family DNA-binding protein [Anabaena sp. FACHB-1237]MBD2138173.1 ComEA family DNA-binding protein [Anabaena sp. FACHB-1237]